jgi:hypothetical protein
VRGLGWSWVGGNFADHLVLAEGKADAADISYGDMEGAEDEFGALQVDGVADEGVDDFHEGGLDGLLVLDEGDGMETGVGRSGHAANHALMEVAELLSAKSGRAATESGDLDVGANFDIGMNWHTGPLDNFLVVTG